MVDFIKDILFFDPRNPIVFTTFFFWIFFLIVLIGYTIFSKNNILRTSYLVVLSLFFYYKCSGFFFILLIITTIINYFIGNFIFCSKNKISKTFFLTISIIINLLMLSYFKYTYFISDSINHIFGTKIIVYDFLLDTTNNIFGTSFNISKILLPAGISFYMFQTMSYTIDVFKGKVSPVKNIIDFGFFVSFFPLLLAGPILRAADFIPQIYKKFEISKYEFGMAIFLILKGLIKKIMIGDYLAVNFIDRVFSSPERYSGIENFMATVAYSLQVYMDFSAYSDIAIALALIMGFRISENFNSPYKSKNCGEFWKRWHISLSTWLKDYLYIPLGGNRKASIGTFLTAGLLILIFILLSKTLIITIILLAIATTLILLAQFVPKTKKTIVTNTNLMITMLLGGLWHGSSWNFLIWGGLNGAGIVVYKFWRKISPYENINRWWATILKITLTFSFITFTRIFFRAKDFDTALTVIYKIRTNFNFNIIPQIIIGYWKIWIILILGFISQWMSSKVKNNFRDKFINSSYLSKIIIVVVVIFIIYQSVCADSQPFIYFQF